MTEKTENEEDVRIMLERALSSLATIKKSVEQAEEAMGDLLYDIEKGERKGK